MTILEFYKAAAKNFVKEFSKIKKHDDEIKNWGELPLTLYIGENQDGEAVHIGTVRFYIETTADWDSWEIDTAEYEDRPWRLDKELLEELIFEELRIYQLSKDI